MLELNLRKKLIEKKYFMIAASIYLLFSLSIDLRNYIVYGDIFIVSGDLLDSLNSYFALPGGAPAILLTFIVYQNIHNYDSYFLWIFVLLFNSIFYGIVTQLIYNFFKKILQTK
jgi:hypothetical protein